MAEKVNIHCDGVVFNNSFGNKNKLDGHHSSTINHHHNSSQSTPSSSSQHPVDRLKLLYPNVNENETPLPRSWSSHDKCHAIGLSQNNLRVQYKGAGKSHSDAASVRTAHSIPAACGLYYFEVKIISKGKNGYMGIGLTSQNFKMNRLPGWDKQSYGYHGDDGNSFCSSGNGQPYGPTFTTGDIIGCGVNLVNNTCFYTKNGLDLGIAFRDLPSKLYPTVGLQTPGEEVDANFGQEPFKFDQIEDMIKQMRAETRAAIYNFPLPSDQGDSTGLLHKMVSSYLVHNGYSLTAETFAKTTGQNFSEEISSIKNRQKILKLVMSGRMGQAIEHTINSYPGLLENNKNLLFMLKCRQFIEMINGSDVEGPIINTTPTTSTINNGITEEINTNSTNNNNSNNNNINNNGTQQATTSGSIETPSTSTDAITTTNATSNNNNINYINNTNNNNNNNNNNNITSSTTNNISSAKTSPVQTSVIQSTKSYQNGTSQNNTVINDCGQDNQEINSKSDLSNNGSDSSKISSDIDLKDGYENNATGIDYNTDIEMENGHLSNGTFKNGNADNFTNSVDTDEDMDIDVAPSRKYGTGFERILEFGRELSQMGQQLEKENKMNDDDRQMLEDAFSLIAYSNPWASPLGWQLCPSKRETVCAALNSAILQSMNYSWRPPLEICVAHAYELLRLMANSSLGSCAFVSIEDIFSQN